MDLSKKRKAEENASSIAASCAFPAPTSLTPEDARKIIEPLSQNQLLGILQTAVVRHPDVLDAVRSISDGDFSQRKLFIRGLGWDTTTEKLRSLFSSYGELDDAIVILDKGTGKSKGFGFITFKHIDGALLALKEPSKKIDGRMTVSQLAAVGASGPAANVLNASDGSDVSLRKIYVGSVPQDVSSDRLLGHFSSYGEILEGPLGFDKQTGKLRGFAFFVYKTEEGARASLLDPIKNIDGHQLVCKLAADGKKGKPGAANDGMSDRIGMPRPTSMPGPMNPQYGVPQFAGGLSSTFQGPSGLNSSFPTMLPNMSSSIGGNVGNSFSNPPYGGPGSVDYGTSTNMGSSMYMLPPSSMAMTSGGYPESGNNSISPVFTHNPQSSIPRVPPGGMYQGLPPYY